MRKTPGRSGSTKVQIAERRAGRDVVLEHVGTARTDAELEALMALARRRMHEGQGTLDLAGLDDVDEGTDARPAPITSKPDSCHLSLEARSRRRLRCSGPRARAE